MPEEGHAGSTTESYGMIAIFLHWITTALVAAAYLLSVGGPESRVYSAVRDFDRSLHETLGLAVFGVVVLRLMWRMFDRAPATPPMPSWMELSAKLAHWALYGLLVAIPATAIIGSWLEGHPLTVLLVGDLAPLIGPSHALGQTIISIHTTLGNVIVWVAGAHAAAALFHHFVLRDTVLLSMLPAVPPRAWN